MEIKVVDGPKCPLCGGVEVLLGGPVRPFKIHTGSDGGWSSNCTDCKIWFDECDWIEVDLREVDGYVAYFSIAEIAEFETSTEAQWPPKNDALILKCREALKASA